MKKFLVLIALSVIAGCSTPAPQTLPKIRPDRQIFRETRKEMQENLDEIMEKSAAGVPEPKIPDMPKS